MKNLFLTIFLMSGICSCSPTYQACRDKFGSDTLVTFKDTLYIHYDTIYVAGSKLEGEISLEDLLANEYVKDSARQTIVIKYKDGKIKYRNICKGDTIYKFDTIKIVHTKYLTNNFKDEGIIQKMYDEIKWWWWLILAITIISIGYFLKK